MYRWIFITTALFTVGASEKKYRLRFSRSKVDLFKCIEEHNLLNIENLYKNTDIGTIIAYVFSERFSGTTVIARALLHEEVQYKILSTHFDNDIFKEWILYSDTRTHLEMVTVKVLEDCSDDENNLNSISSTSNFSDGLQSVDLPHFMDEPNRAGVILDYMLVDWIFPIDTMIRTRYGRAILRRYANDAQRILECTLNSTYSHGYFRLLVRVMWHERAELFFDDRNYRVPYFPHRYAIHSVAPHTYGDTNLFYTRFSQASNNRNHRLSPKYLHSILNIHPARTSNLDIFDVFSKYKKLGMDSASYYLENHIHQFYRILFFFQELRARGIRSDDDDIYPRAIPYDLMPKELQDIINDDSVYRDYLLTRRNDLLASGLNNEISRNVARTPRVYEEDLLVFTRIMNYRRSAATTTTTSTTTTTTTSRTTSTTAAPAPFGPSKKGGVYVNEHGKHFPKERREFLDDCSEYGADNLNPGDDLKYLESICHEKQHKNLEMNLINLCFVVPQKQYHTKNDLEYNRYTTDNNDFKRQFIQPEKKSFSSVLRTLFLQVFSGAHYNELR